MKSIFLLAAAAGVAGAGLLATAAAASSHMTDVDYLRANRCRGIAAGLGVTDTGSLDALIKSESMSRQEVIFEKGQQEMDRAKRDASHNDSKERLTAELNGPCLAYMSGGKT